MTAEAQTIVEHALALPVHERRYVVQVLLDSLADGSPDRIDPTWHAEVRRRIEEVRSGEVQLETLSEVRRQIREALAR